MTQQLKKSCPSPLPTTRLQWHFKRIFSNQSHCLGGRGRGAGGFGVSHNKIYLIPHKALGYSCDLSLIGS